MESNYDSLQLKNQLCFPIYLCAKELTRKYNKVLKKFNLTYTQYIVMMYFWEYKESNVKDLSKILLIDSSTLTPLLRNLKKKGYLKREKALNDERNLLISLTKKGLLLRDDVLEVPKEIGKCIDLEKTEAETLYKLIYKTLIEVEKDINGQK